jgi:cyclopropane-fatty-acyl-phospholipid synthase
VTTLARWRERYVGRLEEVRALGFDERFCRTWEFYLAYCEAAFASRAIRNVQLVLARPFERAPLGSIPAGMLEVEALVQQ